MKPVHAKPYPTQFLHTSTFQKELHHLCKIGVLQEAPYPTQWASPTFITPKKDGRVRWVSDFRELNKALIRDIYPLPVIHSVIMKRKGFKFFTKLDLTMMYYSMELD